MYELVASPRAEIAMKLVGPLLSKSNLILLVTEELKNILAKLPDICNASVGITVPIPTFPAKYALPVVVAPPLTVSPPACVPSPMVEDASAYRPWVKPMRVEVELATVEPKVVAVNGKAKLV
jgi:hypothetical protein